MRFDTSRFKLLTVLLRFAYGTIEMMIPVVLCATALHYTDNPRRIEFNLKCGPCRICSLLR